MCLLWLPTIDHVLFGSAFLNQNHGLHFWVFPHCYKTSTTEVKLFSPVVFSPGPKASLLLFFPLLMMLVENAFLICPLSEVFYPLTVPFFLLSFLETSYLLPSPNSPSRRREPALTFEHLPKISKSHECVSLGRTVPWEWAGLTLDRDPEDS